jgi:hypothetical protein
LFCFWFSFYNLICNLLNNKYKLLSISYHREVKTRLTLSVSPGLTLTSSRNCSLLSTSKTFKIINKIKDKYLKKRLFEILFIFYNIRFLLINNSYLTNICGHFIYIFGDFDWFQHTSKVPCSLSPDALAF